MGWGREEGGGRGVSPSNLDCRALTRVLTSLHPGPA